MTDNEVMEKIYKALVQDKEVMAILGNPRTPKERRDKIHMTRKELEVLDGASMPMLVMFWHGGGDTQNSYYIRQSLVIQYYATDREQGVRLKGAVRRVMTTMDYRRSSSGDNSGKFFCCSDIFKVIVWN